MSSTPTPAPTPARPATVEPPTPENILLMTIASGGNRAACLHAILDGFADSINAALAARCPAPPKAEAREALADGSACKCPNCGGAMLPRSGHHDEGEPVLRCMTCGKKRSLSRLVDAAPAPLPPGYTVPEEQRFAEWACSEPDCPEVNPSWARRCRLCGANRPAPASPPPPQGVVAALPLRATEYYGKPPAPPQGVSQAVAPEAAGKTAGEREDAEISAVFNQMLARMGIDPDDIRYEHVRAILATEIRRIAADARKSGMEEAAKVADGMLPTRGNGLGELVQYNFPDEVARRIRAIASTPPAPNTTRPAEPGYWTPDPDAVAKRHYPKHPGKILRSLIAEQDAANAKGQTP